MAADGSLFIPNPYEPTKPFACVTLATVIKFFPTNYLTWKLQVEALLNGFDLLKYPDGFLPSPPELLPNSSTPPVLSPNPAYQSWRRQDRLIYGALLTTLFNEVASLVSQTTTSHDLWSLLQRTYAKASRGHVKQLKDRLRTASKGALSITAYMHSLKVLLASIGHPVSTEDLTDHILCGLDEGYRPVIEGVNAHDSPVTFDDLLEKLITQELLNTAAQCHNPVPASALIVSALVLHLSHGRHPHHLLSILARLFEATLPDPILENVNGAISRVMCCLSALSSGISIPPFLRPLIVVWHLPCLG